MRRILAWVCIFALLFPCVASADDAFSADPEKINLAALSVLMLEVRDNTGNAIATGSGFVAFDNKTLITNYHVIEDAHMIFGYSDAGYNYIIDRVFAADKDKDIAILGFYSPTDLPPLTLGTDTEVVRAAPAVAIGSPKGFTNTVSIGNISAVFSEYDTSYIQFTAPISSGSSGGALFDDQGKVIGITTLSYDDGQGINQNLNFAVHIKEAVSLYESADLNDYVYLSELSSPAPTPTIKPTPSPTVKPTQKPTAKPTPTYKKIYKMLILGDEGEAVKKLQLALIQYGYLSGEADGIFGEKTRQAVIDFQLANDLLSLIDYGIASNKTQQLLFDGTPISYREPKMTLRIAEPSSYAQWEEYKDKLSIQFQVENFGKKKTVKAFELYVYAEDVWGNRIYGDDVYYATTQKKVKPGAILYCDYITIPERSKINRVYCGIHQVIYTDGTIAIADTVDYACWTID